MSEPFIVKQPLLILFEDGGNTHCHIHPSPDYTYQHYGLIIADVIRHVAAAYKVSEEDVFEWVQKEMDRPSTKLSGGRPS